MGVLLTSLAAAQPAPGEVVFETAFEGAQALAGWSGNAQLQPGHEGGQSVCIERTDPSGPSAFIARSISADKVRGCVLFCSGWVRAENVSEKPQSWNGVKFMLPIEAPSGRQWPQAQIGTGTFDWKPVRFAVRVPDDATSVQLLLGLEMVTGKAWFDDVKITIAKPAMKRAGKRAAIMYRGHNLPRLRGTMVSPRTLDEPSLRTLGQE